MTLSTYICMRCKVWVAEEHEGPPVRAEQRVLCKVCCRKAVDNAFGVLVRLNLKGAVNERRSEQAVDPYRA